MTTALKMQKGWRSGFVATVALCILLLNALVSASPGRIASPVSFEHGATAVVGLCDAGKPNDMGHAPGQGHHRTCLVCLACAYGVEFERARACENTVVFVSPDTARALALSIFDDRPAKGGGLSKSWSSRGPPIFS
jgi:hypothetical protein